MFGLGSLQLAGIAGAAVLAAVGGFTLGTKLQAGNVERAKATTLKWKTAADAWQANANAWKASYSRSEQLRGQEQGEAINALNDASRDCNARVAQVRASADRLRDLIRRPVKVDAAGCPVRALWGADDLRGVLQPGVR